jgi:ribosomal protein L7/L12
MYIGILEMLIVAVLVVLMVAVFVAVMRGREASEQSIRVPDEMDWDAANDEEVRDLIAQHKKIEAIKAYRILTGAGLKESKDAIEYVMANPDASGEKHKKVVYEAPDAGIRDLIKAGRIDEAVEVYRKFAGVDEYTARDAVAEIEHETESKEANPVAEAHLRELILKGNKIQAVKEYRESSGLGLKEAKDAIDEMEKHLRLK